MGWMSDDSKHEGYLIGLVEERDAWGGRTGAFRELTYRLDKDSRDPVKLEYVCVGCECGWRSPRMLAPSGTEWAPCHVWIAHGSDDAIVAGYEETARKLWAAHVREVTAAPPYLRIDWDEHDRVARERFRRDDERNRKEGDLK